MKNLTFDTRVSDIRIPLQFSSPQERKLGQTLMKLLFDLPWKLYYNACIWWWFLSHYTIGLSSSTWMKLVTEFSPQCVFSLIYTEKSEQKEQNGCVQSIITYQ
jgi:hypothetical protein